MKPAPKKVANSSASRQARGGGAFRRLSPEERRTQIIDMAASMFSERPYAELNVKEVALAVGVTDNLVYHYFTNKEALFLAAFEQRAADLLNSCLPPRELPVFHQLERAVKGYLDFVEANSTAYLNLFRGSNASEAHVQRLCETTRSCIMERYLDGLGVQHRSVPTTRLALRGYVGFVEEIILGWLQERAVPRASLERLIFVAAGNTLVEALEIDAAFPPGFSAESFRAAYRQHFSLV